MKTFRNESGAFDMPSIIIGVIVVGILTAGVLAIIFGVVPWAQDRAAKQDLGAVVTAQGTVKAWSAADGPGVYLNKADLITRGVITPGDSYNTRASSDGGCFTATAQSKSGKVFWADSDDNTAKEYVSGVKSSCGMLKGLAGDLGKEMDSTWNIAAGQTITLPLGGKVSVMIDWGDGVVDTVTTARPSHTFAVANPTQTITIDGTFAKWGGSGWVDTAKSLLSVDDWGETGTTDLSYAFYEADNLKHVEAIPKTTINLSYAFRSVDSDFTIGYFDTSSVTNMYWMFGETGAFNQPLSFDTGSVTNMSAMFWRAKAFNQPLNFDTKNVTSMNSMFSAATAFNQPVNFDTKNVTSMSSMFSDAKAFNQPLNFDTSRVTSMHGMFRSATTFNLPLNFDTKNVTDMHGMFSTATSFNQPLNFDTKSVTDMGTMFNMATSFNQPLNFTSTSSGTGMGHMFYGAKAFNQPLNFDTSNVVGMGLMFYDATTFNQDLSAWNVDKVTSRDNFSNGTKWILPKPIFI